MLLSLQTLSGLSTKYLVVTNNELEIKTPAVMKVLFVNYNKDLDIKLEQA